MIRKRSDTLDAVDLKKYIYEKGLVEFILNSIGCHNVKYHSTKDYYTCGNYNGDNVSAITVKNNKYLNVKNYTRQKDFDDDSDIITLVQYNKQYTFVEAVKFLHGILGLKYKWEKKPKKDKVREDPLHIFKKHKIRDRVDVSEINTIEESELIDYVPLLFIGWLREGIIEKTKKKFGLCYSYKQKRVIIPLRHWDTGMLLGTNKRTTVENFEEFGIKKYLITPSYQKSWNLYGLYENRTEIEKKKILTVVESEKSVLKRDSLNDSTLVALSGKTMSNEQVSIIKGLNINEVVIALDKDVPIEEVWHICNKLYGHFKVSYIWDSWDLLGKKDSPADASNKAYSFLFENRICYDADKQRQYLSKLNKK